MSSDKRDSNLDDHTKKPILKTKSFVPKSKNGVEMIRVPGIHVNQVLNTCIQETYGVSNHGILVTAKGKQLMEVFESSKTGATIKSNKNRNGKNVNQYVLTLIVSQSLIMKTNHSPRIDFNLDLTPNMEQTELISSDDSDFVGATNEVVETIPNSKNDSISKKNKEFLANSWATLAEKIDFNGLEDAQEDLDPNFSQVRTCYVKVQKEKSIEKNKFRTTPRSLL